MSDHEMTRGDAAVRTSLIVSMAGVVWAVFWLLDSFADVPSIAELIVPLVAVVLGVAAAALAALGLRRGTSQRGSAAVGLFFGAILIVWGIALVPVSIESG